MSVGISTVAEGFFTSYMDYGYLTIDQEKDLDSQLVAIAETLSRRMLSERADAATAALGANGAAS